MDLSGLFIWTFAKIRKSNHLFSAQYMLLLYQKAISFSIYAINGLFRMTGMDLSHVNSLFYLILLPKFIKFYIYEMCTKVT